LHDTRGSDIIELKNPMSVVSELYALKAVKGRETMINYNDEAINASHPARVAAGLNAGKAMQTSSCQQGGEADSGAVQAFADQQGVETHSAAVQEESQDSFAADKKEDSDEIVILHEFVKSQGKSPDVYEDASAIDTAAEDGNARATIDSPGAPADGATREEEIREDGSLETGAVTGNSEEALSRETDDDAHAQKTDTGRASKDDEKDSPEGLRYQKPALIPFKDNDDPYETCNSGAENRTGGCSSGAQAGTSCIDGASAFAYFKPMPESK
jgi:hypothetical protein